MRWDTTSFATSMPFAGSQPLRTRRSRLVALPLVFILITAGNAPTKGIGDAVEAGESTPVAPIPGSTHEIKISDRGRIQFHVGDMPLSQALQILSAESQRNIIVSPGVKGTVTANLFDVSFGEAMKAILTPNGASHVQQGNFIYVYTKQELAAMDASRKEKQVTKVIRLNYLSAKDALAYAKPLIGEENTITLAGADASGEGGSFATAEKDFIIITADPDTIKLVERIIEQIDVRPKQVLVEATILRANLNDDNALGVDFTLVGGVDLELLGASSSGVQNLVLGQLPESRFEKFNSATTTNFAKDVPDGGITVGVIKDNVGVFLRALEQVTDTTVLANPKVLALNKQEAEVIVGRRDGYLTTTVTETQAVQTVEFLETGTQLVFRPYIANDGYVRVQLHPEDSVGFVNAQGLPSEQTTEVTTNVLIRDGETILIGGLFREVTTDARNQVPFLGSIPGIGPLFRSNNDSTAREEIIILMTLHIVKNPDVYEEESMRLLQHIESMRVGLRQGLMWHGRDRLAQIHYQKATDAYAHGDRRNALWHAQMALHNNARHISAIELKEKLLGERAWDDDGASNRTFLHRILGRERGDLRPAFGRPAPPFTEFSEDGADLTSPADPPQED